MFKIGDKIIAKPPPYKGQVGVITHIDGSYIDIKFEGNRHITELYPNEIELINQKSKMTNLDVIKQMFIKGFSLSCPPEELEQAIKIANRVWETTYESEAKKLLETQ